MWTLCQLTGQLASAADPEASAALFVGTAELVEDVAQTVEIQLAAAQHSWHAGHHGRGLHSFTFQLNVSAFCGIGVAYRGAFGCGREVSGGIRGC